jgi:hypothetical protein
VLFRAGQLSVKQHRWLWPGASAGLAVLSTTLATIMLLQPSPQPIERPIYVHVQPHQVQLGPMAETASGQPDIARSTAPRADDYRAPFNCYQLEQLVLRWGVEGLPNPQTAGGQEQNGDAPLGMSTDLQDAYRRLEMQNP